MTKITNNNNLVMDTPLKLNRFECRIKERKLWQ